MDPSQERILLDLARDYRDKVRRGAAHMHEMCELADIPETVMLETVCSVNLHIITEIIDLKTDMSAEDFGSMCADALRQRRANTRRARRAAANKS